MMAAFLSDQEVARAGSGAAPSRKLWAHEAGGRLSAARFAVKLPAVGLAMGDVIHLARLPSGVSVLGGVLIWDRPQGRATTALGIAGEPAKYGSGITDRFGETFETHGQVTTTEEILVATNEVEPWHPGSALAGYVMFVGS